MYPSVRCRDHASSGTPPALAHIRELCVVQLRSRRGPKCLPGDRGLPAPSSFLLSNYFCLVRFIYGRGILLPHRVSFETHGDPFFFFRDTVSHSDPRQSFPPPSDTYGPVSPSSPPRFPIPLHVEHLDNEPPGLHGPWTRKHGSFPAHTGTTAGLTPECRTTRPSRAWTAHSLPSPYFHSPHASLFPRP